MDPVAATAVTAEFCLVEGRDKTGHNVIYYGACQQLNSKLSSTAQANFLDKIFFTMVTKKEMNSKMSD